MSLTLKTRSGKSFKRDIYFWQPANEDGSQDLVNTTGFTARVQLRSSQANHRVLLSSHEYNGSLPAPSGTVLTRIEPGHWLLFLGKSITRSLPSRVRIEVELVNDANAEDVTALFEAALMVEPEVVVNA